MSVCHVPTFLRFYVLNYLYNSAYPLSYSSTGFIKPITSRVSSLSSRNINNIKSVTLAPSSLASSLKIYSILESLIRDIIFPKLI